MHRGDPSPFLKEALLKPYNDYCNESNICTKLEPNVDSISSGKLTIIVKKYFIYKFRNHLFFNLKPYDF